MSGGYRGRVSSVPVFYYGLEFVLGRGLGGHGMLFANIVNYRIKCSNSMIGGMIRYADSLGNNFSRC